MFEFVRYSHAWYAPLNGPVEDGCTEEFMLSDGAGQEFSVRWFENTRGLVYAPKVCVFNDAFRFCFVGCADILEEMHGRDVTPDQFEEFLKGRGWKDATVADNPYERRA